MNGWRAGTVLAAALAAVALTSTSSGTVPKASSGTVPKAAVASVPANIDVTPMLGNQAENAIAINPVDPSNIVAMAVAVGSKKGGLEEGFSFDGGQTWTRQLIGTGAPLGSICCNQQVAWDGYGNLWMTYLVNGNPDTFVALSTDGGRTFTKVADVVPGPGNLGGGNLTKYADQPSIAVGANSVWVHYSFQPSGTIYAFGAPVTGLGKFGAFSPIESVPTSSAGDLGGTAVGPNGQVVVGYQNNAFGANGSDIYTALDPDGLGSQGFGPPRLLAHSNVGGLTPIPAKPDADIDAHIYLAYDNSGGPHTGRLYAVWVQRVGTTADSNIEFQYSDDNGATWAQPVQLNDDHTANSQFDPAIAVDQSDGNVAVSWYDCRNDLGHGGPGDTDGIPNDDAQVWATYSTDGGTTFAPNFQVSQGTSNAKDAKAGTYEYGDYTEAAFQSGLFYPAWSDNSNSTGTNPNGTLHQFDLYTAKVAIP